MTTKRAGKRSGARANASFAHALARDAELSELRAEYAAKPALQRQRAAEWAYDESIATSLVAGALGRARTRGLLEPRWPAGFAALAIEPQYGPAMLTVGCYEYASGRPAEGLGLLLGLAQLPPHTPDWIELIDKAGEFLMEAGDPDNVCLSYTRALLTQPEEQELIIGMGWALCRAGKHVEALPWMKKAVANAPGESSVLSDYGWALTELGRLEEAEPILEEAVRLASPDDDLPANNLARLRELRQRVPTAPPTNSQT